MNPIPNPPRISPIKLTWISKKFERTSVWVTPLAVKFLVEWNVTKMHRNVTIEVPGDKNKIEVKVGTDLALLNSFYIRINGRTFNTPSSKNFL